MKIYLVQGTHPTSPGHPMTPFVSLARAAEAALDLVNAVRLEPVGHDYDAEAGGEEIVLPQLPAGSDWQEGIRDWQRAKVAHNHVEGGGTEEMSTAIANAMGDDELAEESEGDVYISELEIADAPDMPAVLVDYLEAGEEAVRLMRSDGGFEENLSEAAEKLADALQMMRFAAIWQANPKFVAVSRGLQPAELAELQGLTLRPRSTLDLAMLFAGTGAPDLARRDFLPGDVFRAFGGIVASPPCKAFSDSDAVERATARARARLNAAFGIGATDAEHILRTSVEAKRIYDCAVLALIQAGDDVTAREWVDRWNEEWLASDDAGGPNWGDKIDWTTACAVADRLDGAMA